MRDGVARHGPVRAGVYAMTTPDGREGRRRMSLVFAGICSHAPGITGRAGMADPALREPFYAAYHRLREQLSGAAPGRPDRRRRRALRQLLHEQHAELRHRHGGPLQRSDRGSGLARHPAHQRSGQCRALATTDLRDHADGRCRVRRGVEVRPRHHGAAALPDSGLRPGRHAGQHQLPGPAARAAAPRLGLRRGVAARRGPASRSASPRRHRRHLALAGDARLRKDQRSLGPAAPGALGAQRQGRPCCRTPTLDTYRDAGQGGFEIRTFISVAAAARGRGHVQHYAPIPIFAVGCTIATMDIAA